MKVACRRDIYAMGDRMKYYMKLILITSLAFALPSANSAEPEIKGISPGMSEKALLQTYPNASCRVVTSECTKTKFRRCEINDLTIANYKTAIANVDIFNDKVTEIKITFRTSELNNLLEALESKFGKSASFGSGSSIWKFQEGTEIMLIPSVNYLVMSTKKSLELEQAENKCKQQAANADL